MSICWIFNTITFDTWSFDTAVLYVLGYLLWTSGHSCIENFPRCTISSHQVSDKLINFFLSPINQNKKNRQKMKKITHIFLLHRHQNRIDRSMTMSLWWQSQNAWPDNCLSVCLSLSVCLFVCLSVSAYVCLCLSVCLSVFICPLGLWKRLLAARQKFYQLVIQGSHMVSLGASNSKSWLLLFNLFT